MSTPSRSNIPLLIHRIPHPFSDASTQAAVSAAEEGFKLVQVGIASIANAILTNQAPPPESRDQVGTGIIQVKTALAGINGLVADSPYTLRIHS